MGGIGIGMVRPPSTGHYCGRLWQEKKGQRRRRGWWWCWKMRIITRVQIMMRDEEEEERRRKGGIKKTQYQFLHSPYKYHSSPLFLGTSPLIMVSAFVVSPKPTQTYNHLLLLYRQLLPMHGNNIHTFYTPYACTLENISMAHFAS